MDRRVMHRVDRETFLALLGAQVPDDETDFAPLQYLRDPMDNSWHLVNGDAASENGMLKTCCDRELAQLSDQVRGEPLACTTCVEHQAVWEQIADRNRRNFLEVSEPLPVLIRDGDHTWIGPELGELSDRAMAFLVKAASHRDAHVYALPGNAWGFASAKAEPDLSRRLMLEERRQEQEH